MIYKKGEAKGSDLNILKTIIAQGFPFFTRLEKGEKAASSRSTWSGKFFEVHRQKAGDMINYIGVLNSIQTCLGGRNECKKDKRKIQG